MYTYMKVIFDKIWLADSKCNEKTLKIKGKISKTIRWLKKQQKTMIPERNRIDTKWNEKSWEEITVSESVRNNPKVPEETRTLSKMGGIDENE